MESVLELNYSFYFNAVENSEHKLVCVWKVIEINSVMLLVPN